MVRRRLLRLLLSSDENISLPLHPSHNTAHRLHALASFRSIPFYSPRQPEQGQQHRERERENERADWREAAVHLPCCCGCCLSCHFFSTSTSAPASTRQALAAAAAAAVASSRRRDCSSSRLRLASRCCHWRPPMQVEQAGGRATGARRFQFGNFSQLSRQLTTTRWLPPAGSLVSTTTARRCRCRRRCRRRSIASINEAP